jgi:hypothetical protein
MNPELDECLRMESIEFMVVDDNDDDFSAYIGAVKIPLTPLADGQAVEANFQLISNEGTVAGFISLRLLWLHPYLENTAVANPQSAALALAAQAPLPGASAAAAPIAEPHATLSDDEYDLPDNELALTGSPDVIPDPTPPDHALDTWGQSSAPSIQIDEEIAEVADGDGREAELADAGWDEEYDQAGPLMDSLHADDATGTRGSQMSTLEQSGETATTSATSKSGGDDSRRLREIAPNGHIVIEAVRFLENAPPSITKLRSQLFVLFHATWLGFK